MQGEADYRKLSELPLSRAINHNKHPPRPSLFPALLFSFKEMISEELTAVAERDCLE